MATQGEQPAPVKNRWTRWYMWFVYSSVGFLIVVIVIALFADTPEPANTTPEERMAHLEATQAAEAIAATRQASEQQTKEAAERFEEQTKTAEKQAEQQTKKAEDLHEQQTKEAESRPPGLGISREELQTRLSTNVGIVWEYPPSELRDGTPRVLGDRQDTGLTAELIGPPDNITTASMLFAHESIEATTLNYLSFQVFVAETLPQWEDGYDWVGDALTDLVEDGRKKSKFVSVKSSSESNT